MIPPKYSSKKWQKTSMIKTNHNSKPPEVNSLIKIHTTNNAIWSLIDFKKVPIYKIVKILTHKLNNSNTNNKYKSEIPQN